ncbi:MAG: cytochrome c biogenesis protein CcdA [Thermoleophilia bacterium]
MAERIPIAFLAGLLSFLAPCVLPLVPGYLSAVSAVGADDLGRPGVSRRVVLASLPFVAGFTVVFVALGALSGLAGGLLGGDRRLVYSVAGFLIVLLGLAFMGLLPFPERLLVPELVSSARRRGSSTLLGAAFAVCAAPCVGPVLGSILVLAGDSSTVAQGSLLLFAYSIGLAVPFLLAGIAFTRAMGAFRWLRDRYFMIRVGSGAVLVALGLLLFFERYWWLNAALSHVLDSLGLQG